MWRKVIWDQVVKVGVRPRAVRRISTSILGIQQPTEWRRVLTFIPPSSADTQVLIILSFWDFSVLVMGLGDGIVCLTGTFSDQLLTDTVGYVCLCGTACALTDFFCDRAGWIF